MAGTLIISVFVGPGRRNFLAFTLECPPLPYGTRHFDPLEGLAEYVNNLYFL